MKYTGARILIEALIEQGVDTVFGIPGGAVLNIYDELYRQRKRIRHILVSHEQHAAHAADGYARSSGRIGVCIASSGPGATNLITGIATAFMDSVPLVAITGNVPTGLLGRDSFQEVDIAGISMPVVKHNWIVKDPSDLAEIVREAFIVAAMERPGPVLIDIPKDITALSAEWIPLRKRIAEDGNPCSRAGRLVKRKARRVLNQAQLTKALTLLTEAKRPLLYAGGGVIISGAGPELKALAERLNAPVAVSLMGIGAIPSEHQLCTGLIGMHGTTASNRAAQNADLLVAAGARFSDRVTSHTESFAKNAKILHLDIDPAEIRKNIGTHAEVVGDLKETLSLLLDLIPPRTNPQWIKEIEKWKKAPAQSPGASGKNRLSPGFVIRETVKTLGEKVIVVTDVGQHQIWAAQSFPASRPRSFLSPGGLGTMGFGLGAASGAAIANPGQPVALFTGDGCFRMNSAEMGTLVSAGLSILIVVFNNQSLGMVRQWQHLFYEKRYSETDLSPSPDFVKLAAAYGIEAAPARDPAAFRGALAKAETRLAAGQSFLIDVEIDRDEQVLPMVPLGAAIDRQIL